MDPRNQEPEKFFGDALALGISAPSARRILHDVLASGTFDTAGWLRRGILPKRFSDEFQSDRRLKLEKDVSSAKDGFRKLLFRTEDGLPIETVLIPLHKPQMSSICLSSQVGCVMGCVFCQTARMPVRRNLEAWEIVDQFLQARALLKADGRRVSGAVFMGMGEPFLNYERVIAAAKLLSFPTANAIAGKAITISTVGHVREIDRFTDEGHKFRLSISLGAATDEKRALLVPVAARTPVSDVMAAARRHAEKRRDRVMLSYVCISGMNVAEEDARALPDSSAILQCASTSSM